mmetsp:Transcript_23583/g.47754  ORF Transcript_23583/g.47754 Transcript_23583/m.47754 type:complete len:230 (+) Transcript_23583:166-855(+)
MAPAAQDLQRGLQAAPLRPRAGAQRPRGRLTHDQPLGEGPSRAVLRQRLGAHHRCPGEVRLRHGLRRPSLAPGLRGRAAPHDGLRAQPVPLPDAPPPDIEQPSLLGCSGRHRGGRAEVHRAAAQPGGRGRRRSGQPGVEGGRGRGRQPGRQPRAREPPDLPLRGARHHRERAELGSVPHGEPPCRRGEVAGGVARPWARPAVRRCRPRAVPRSRGEGDVAPLPLCRLHA